MTMNYALITSLTLIIDVNLLRRNDNLILSRQKQNCKKKLSHIAQSNNSISHIGRHMTNDVDFVDDLLFLISLGRVNNQDYLFPIVDYANQVYRNTVEAQQQNGECKFKLSLKNQ